MDLKNLLHLACSSSFPDCLLSGSYLIKQIYSNSSLSYAKNISPNLYSDVLELVQVSGSSLSNLADPTKQAQL